MGEWGEDGAKSRATLAATTAIRICKPVEYCASRQYTTLHGRALGPSRALGSGRQNDHSKSAVVLGWPALAGGQLKYVSHTEVSTSSAGGSGSGTTTARRVSQCVQLSDTHLGTRRNTCSTGRTSIATGGSGGSCGSSE